MVVASSLLMGAVVGLIIVAIFALALRRRANENTSAAIKVLRALIPIILGGGFSDYLIFDVIIKNGALEYYIIGLSAVFLTFGILVFVQGNRVLTKEHFE